MIESIDPDIFSNFRIAVENKNIDSIIDNFNKLGYDTSRANFKHELERKNQAGELTEYCELILFVMRKNKTKTKTD